MVQRSLSTNLSKNTALFHALLPLDDSFDLITRDLKLGNTPAYWIGVNGFCKTEILQQIFSDLQDPLYTLDSEIRDLPRYVQSKLGYAQVPNLTPNGSPVVPGTVLWRRCCSIPI